MANKTTESPPIPEGITPDNSLEKKIDDLLVSFSDTANSIKDLIKTVAKNESFSIINKEENFVSAINKTYRYLISKEALNVEEFSRLIEKSFGYLEKLKSIQENFSEYKKEYESFSKISEKQLDHLIKGEEKRTSILTDIYRIETRQSNLLNSLASKEIGDAKRRQTEYLEHRRILGPDKIPEAEREYNKARVTIDKQFLKADAYQTFLEGENPFSRFANAIHMLRGGRSTKEQTEFKEEQLQREQRRILQKQGRYIPDISKEEDKAWLLEKHGKDIEYEKLEAQRLQKLKQLEKRKPIESFAGIVSSLVPTLRGKKESAEATLEQEGGAEIIPFTPPQAEEVPEGEGAEVIPFTPPQAEEKEAAPEGKEAEIIPLFGETLENSVEQKLDSIEQIVVPYLEEISLTLEKLAKNFMEFEKITPILNEISATLGGNTKDDIKFPEKFHVGGIISKNKEIIAQEGEIILPVAESERALSQGMIEKNQQGGLSLNQDAFSGENMSSTELLQVAKDILSVLQNDIAQKMNQQEPAIPSMLSPLPPKSISFG